jgi:hypothetical protein
VKGAIGCSGDIAEGIEAKLERARHLAESSVRADLLITATFSWYV